MSDAVWVAMGAIAAVIAMGVSVVAWRERHSDRETERIKAIARNESQQMSAQLLELATRLDNVVTRQNDLAAQLHEMNERMGRSLDRLAVMETKIEVFWRSVAMDAAKIIHSPDPRRARVDTLLESFMNGTLTKEEDQELRKVLIVMRDAEPGRSPDPGFPVYPGEQIAAAILLRTMEHALPGGVRA